MVARFACGALELVCCFDYVAVNNARDTGRRSLDSRAGVNRRVNALPGTWVTSVVIIRVTRSGDDFGVGRLDVNTRPQYSTQAIIPINQQFNQSVIRAELIFSYFL